MQKLLSWIEEIGLHRLIWATDLDYTILDGNPQPDEVRAVDGLEEDCQTLDKKTGGKFFIITGREMPYIDQVFPNTKFKASSEYHCASRFNPAAGVQHNVSVPNWDVAQDKFDLIVSGREGLKLRIKPFMRTLHYGYATGIKDAGVKEQLIQNIEDVLQHVEQQTGQKLAYTDTGNVFDMLPHGTDKSRAYEDIIQHIAAQENNAIPLYFGDSAGDLPAARIVQENGGKFIAVGDNQDVRAIADFTLDSTDKARALFKAAALLPSPAP